MERVLCVDPSVSNTGWAYWDSLLEGDYVPPDVSGVIRGRGFDDSLQKFRHVLRTLPLVRKSIIEFPEVQQNAAATQSGALFKLAAVTGAYEALIWTEFGTRSTRVRPSTWKGQLPKKEVMRRIKEKLNMVTRDHEADAVGIGLWAVNGSV